MRLLIFILLSFNVASQPYLAVGITGKGTRTGQTLNSNLTPSAGTLILSAQPGFSKNQCVESSFFYDTAAGHIKIYYTGSSDSTGASFYNNIGLVTTSDMSAFTRYGTTQVIGMGYGGAGATRRAHSSWVAKSGSNYYCVATNGYGYNYSGEDRNVYGYTSTDGITWTSRGIVINKSTAWTSAVNGFGNVGIATDQYNNPVMINGKYVALVEVGGASYWEIYRAEADSIMGAWTLTKKVTTLQVVAGAMYGGPQLFYVNGNYYALYHYGSQTGNLPTYIAMAQSTDCIHWNIKEAPLKTILATPFPNTDQVADPFWCEIGGKMYMIAEYVQNSPTYQGQLRLWSYNGTFLQMINAL